MVQSLASRQSYRLLCSTPDRNERKKNVKNLSNYDEILKYLSDKKEGKGQKREDFFS